MTRARDTAGIIGSNTLTIDTNNAIGIGSTTPDAKFDINGGLIVTGIATVTTLQVTDATISGDLTVQGTTTILDTIVQEVDLLNIQANAVVPAIGVTQSGSGPIAAFYDGVVGVATFKDGGGLDVAGNVTASGFIGDASLLTGVSYASTAGIATNLLGGNAGVNTTTTPTNLYVSGNSASNIVGLGTTNANTTLNFATGNNFSMTLVGSIVLNNPTGMTTGQSGIILISQDNSGSRTVGFASHWDFPSSTAPTLSTGANSLDVITYFVRSSTSIVTNSLIGIGTL